MHPNHRSNFPACVPCFQKPNHLGSFFQRRGRHLSSVCRVCASTCPLPIDTIISHAKFTRVNMARKKCDSLTAIINIATQKSHTLLVSTRFPLNNRKSLLLGEQLWISLPPHDSRQPVEFACVEKSIARSSKFWCCNTDDRHCIYIDIFRYI